MERGRAWTFDVEIKHSTPTDYRNWDADPARISGASGWRNRPPIGRSRHAHFWPNWRRGKRGTSLPQDRLSAAYLPNYGNSPFRVQAKALSRKMPREHI